MEIVVSEFLNALERHGLIEDAWRVTICYTEAGVCMDRTKNLEHANSKLV
jgi:hypothetical protein